MPGFFFRPVDLSSLALFFVALLVGWRLWGLRQRSPASRWLTAFFVSAGLFALCSIVADSRLDAWQFYAIHLQVAFSALSVIALVQYIYHVGNADPYAQEARVVRWISLAALVYIFGWAAYQLMQLSPTGDPSTSTAISEGLTSLSLLWALMLSVRRARNPAEGERPPNLAMLIAGVVMLLAASGFQFVGGITAGFSPKSIYTTYIAAVGVIVIGFNFFLNWDQANTRVNRVIAAALVLLQSTFAVLAVVYSAQLAADPLPAPAIGDIAFRLTPEDQGGYSVEAATEGAKLSGGEILSGQETLIRPDFPLVFFGRQYSSLLIRPGRLLFGDSWSTQKAKYFLQADIFAANLGGAQEQSMVTELARSAEQLTVRWTLPDGGTAEVSIGREGWLELSYAGLGKQALNSWELSAGQGLKEVDFLVEFPPTQQSISASGILFENSFDERIHQDAWTRPILYFQLVVSVLVIAILSAVRSRIDWQHQALVGQALNRQQLEIAQMVAEGRSNAEIGQALSITEATVKYHLTRIFQQLNITDRSSLANWYQDLSHPQD